MTRATNNEAQTRVFRTLDDYENHYYPNRTKEKKQRAIQPTELGRELAHSLVDQLKQQLRASS